MAIKKEITRDDGTAVSYWKIIEIWINYKSNITALQLEGHISQEARQEGKSPAYGLPVSVESLIENREAAYAHLKTTPKFLDAEDC